MTYRPQIPHTVKRGSLSLTIVARLLQILGDDEWWEEVECGPYDGDARTALRGELEELTSQITEEEKT